MSALTGKAKLAGVMGWPVSHSRSPALHGHWLREYGIDGAYVPFAVHPDRLDAALRGLAALGFRGCNITLPHKERALALIDRVSDTARRIGAVNTVSVEEDGTLSGDNTDAFGFIENLREGAPGFKADRGPSVVVGAGGAARAVIAALLDDGSPEIRLVNRTAARAQSLGDAFGARIRVVDWERRAASLDAASLLVNTTTQGMQGQAPLDLDLARLPVDAVVNEIVYVPLETPLLAAARARGNKVVDGIGMLLHQARPGFARWFGVEPKVTPSLRTAVLGTGA